MLCISFKFDAATFNRIISSKIACPPLLFTVYENAWSDIVCFGTKSNQELPGLKIWFAYTNIYTNGLY